jgi:hypothetical protein
MPHLAIAAFATLSEAERAARALLDAGFAAPTLTAVSQTGGGRVRLAGEVPVQAAASPARLANRTERAGAGAIAGMVFGAAGTAAAALLFRQLGLDPLAMARAFLSPVVLTGASIVAGSLLLGAAGALARRGSGLPHELALRYARRLDVGDTIIAVATGDPRHAQAARETMAVAGAVLVDVTRGSLEVES